MSTNGNTDTRGKPHSWVCECQDGALDLEWQSRDGNHRLLISLEPRAGESMWCLVSKTVEGVSRGFDEIDLPALKDAMRLVGAIKDEP